MKKFLLTFILFFITTSAVCMGPIPPFYKQNKEYLHKCFEQLGTQTEVALNIVKAIYQENPDSKEYVTIFENYLNMINKQGLDGRKVSSQKSFFEVLNMVLNIYKKNANLSLEEINNYETALCIDLLLEHKLIGSSCVEGRFKYNFISGDRNKYLIKYFETIEKLLKQKNK